MNLVCARCLGERRPLPIGADRPNTARLAVTVTGGEALCRGHLTETAGHNATIAEKG